MPHVVVLGGHVREEFQQDRLTVFKNKNGRWCPFRSSADFTHSGVHSGLNLRLCFNDRLFFHLGINVVAFLSSHTVEISTTHHIVKAQKIMTYLVALVAVHNAAEAKSITYSYHAGNPAASVLRTGALSVESPHTQSYPDAPPQNPASAINAPWGQNELGRVSDAFLHVEPAGSNCRGRDPGGDRVEDCSVLGLRGRGLREFSDLKLSVKQRKKRGTAHRAIAITTQR